MQGEVILKVDRKREIELNQKTDSVLSLNDNDLQKKNVRRATSGSESYHYS